MDENILEWLLSDDTPEVRLRTLKEYQKLSDDNPKVIECKSKLLQSKIYERGLKKDKPWEKFDAIMAFAEWGLTREDIGSDIDEEVFSLIQSTGFKMLCGEPYLLRNLYRTDNRETPMVDVMLETFYPSDPIKVGVQNIVYALRVLGCPGESEAMQAGYKVLNRYRLDNGRYILTASKSVPAFKAGKIGEENKWITLYAYMAQ